MKNSKKGFVVSLIIAIVAVLVVGGGYIYLQKVKVALNKDRVMSMPSVIPKDYPTPVIQNSDQTKDWKTYTSNPYGFYFKYPKTFLVKSSNIQSNSEIEIRKIDSNELIARISVSDESSRGLTPQKYLDEKIKKEWSSVFVNPTNPISIVGARKMVTAGTPLDKKWIIWLAPEENPWLFVSESYDPYNKDIENILSTFKFTN